MSNHSHNNADVNWTQRITHLERSAQVRSGFFASAMSWLRDRCGESGTHSTPVQRILDIGSGPGVGTELLANAFPGAVVVAVDATPAMLDQVRLRADRLGLGDRVEVRHAELPAGYDGLGTADLVWASDALHHVGDQQQVVTRLGQLLNPGGLLAISEGGLPFRFLPRDIGIGRPGLQARLDAAGEDWFTAMRAGLPGATERVESWPEMLAAAGLTSMGSRSFLVDRPAPVDDDTRQMLHTTLTRLRKTGQGRLDETDLATVDRLLDPHDDAGVFKRADVFYLAATSVHVARAT
ncbi:class I SAM-dependent methyltransferase [Rhodococcus sp. IEGM 1379]|uniref:class I SAM-dependent methyltransferase n=1 Tax=Rhodococcus sp. IEGM 1379 TaxID=3047086 RepID=UPI0024B82DB7|nr:class I SAM-dependent methyltransferase [Rhodococcus sp. IEGM 1379]MDI9915460.1 class I SAM-dependent methyltransferase [Rhodococcus sp. IEGM 1379]